MTKGKNKPFIVIILFCIIITVSSTIVYFATRKASPHKITLNGTTREIFILPKILSNELKLDVSSCRKISFPPLEIDVKSSKKPLTLRYLTGFKEWEETETVNLKSLNIIPRNYNPNDDTIINFL